MCCTATASTCSCLCELLTLIYTCRKKYRALVQSQYDLTEQEIERLLPAKGGSLEVGRLAIPHCPLDGRVDVEVAVYYVNKEPMFFEYNRQWYPTGEW